MIQARSSSLSRRAFLGGLGTALMMPRLVQAQLPTEPNVVVIGAGAAGLAATMTLIERGHSVALIEADNRIGGRCHTDIATFGVPYDIGAHWLHIGHRNPFVDYGKQHGFDIYPAPDKERIFDGDKEVGSGTLWRTVNKMRDAIGKRADSNMDISAARATANVRDEWTATAAMVIGPWSMAKDLENFSIVDWWNSPEGADWYAREGYGTVVADWAREVPVSLDTRANRVDWSGDGVSVETNRGTIRTRAVIVTVSTGVLAAGDIVFSPALPSNKQDSFEKIPMGLYNHITLQFSTDVFGMGNDGYVLFKVGDDRKGFGTLTNAGGHNLAYCDVGGSWAHELERETTEARIDYALGTLRTMLGSDIDRSFVKGAATSWGGNPLTQGAYASAVPGAYRMRSVLRESVGDRIFFAGEACHRSMWATVAGARLSGDEVAREVGTQLSGKEVTNGADR